MKNEIQTIFGVPSDPKYLYYQMVLKLKNMMLILINGILEENMLMIMKN
jgi:hypothetical protein